MSNNIQVGDYNTFFKSSYFYSLPPDGDIKTSSTSEYRSLSDKNIQKFNINYALANTVMQETDSEYRGGYLLFPAVSDNELKQYCIERVKTVADKCISKLKREYWDTKDPVGYYDIDDNGKFFNGDFINKETGERFNNQSVIIYLPGICKTTLAYLTETIFDRYIDKGASRTGNKCKFKTCLVYDLNGNKFYEYGVNDDIIYVKKSNRVNNHFRVYGNIYHEEDKNSPLQQLINMIA